MSETQDEQEQEQEPEPDEQGGDKEPEPDEQGGDKEPEPDEQGGDKEPGTAGLPDADDISDEKKAELDKEREERLADENRPDGAEVDNTQRDFDDAAGMFTDNPDHSEDERPYVTEADMQEDA